MATIEFFRAIFNQMAEAGAIGDPRGQLAYAYLRVSSTAQAEEGRSGLPRQVINVHEAALQHNLRITWDMVFADDHTGFEFRNRPELTRLREEYRHSNRRASFIVIENLDRLSRNADWHQGFLLDEMRQHGLRVVFWKSFSSRIERAVIGAISQEGMEQATQRMMQGNMYKAQSGRVTSKRAAYGYQIVDSHGNTGPTASKDTHYAPKPEEAAVVRDIYLKVGHEGWSTRQLSSYLNAIVPPPRNFATWEPAYLRRLIRNTVYKGEFVARRWQMAKVPSARQNLNEPVKLVVRMVERPHEDWIIVPVPPIVTSGEWEAAVRMLEQNATMSRRNATERYLLTGIVRCATCGYVYNGRRYRQKLRSGGEYVKCNYRCSSRNSRPPHIRDQIACDQGTISCDVLERAVWAAICYLFLQPEQILQALEDEAEDGENARLAQEVQFLEREILARDAEDEKLYRAYQADVFDAAEYASRRRVLRAERDKLERDLRERRSWMVPPERLEERKQMLLGLAQTAQEQGIAIEAPTESKQRIIKLVVDRIILNVRERWFQLEGIVPGQFSLDDGRPVESTSSHTSTSRPRFRTSRGCPCLCRPEE